MSIHREEYDRGLEDAVAGRKVVIDSLSRAMENGRSKVFDPYMRGYQKGLWQRLIDALVSRLEDEGGPTCMKCRALAEHTLRGWYCPEGCFDYRIPEGEELEILRAKIRQARG